MEQNHDDYGPVWPMSIAPWQVELCALNPNRDGVGEAADKLYDELVAAGVEVLYDDRGEKAGFMFSDADLLGIPLRVVVSPKSLAEGKVEFRTRACRDTELVPLAEVADFLKKKIAEAEKECSC
jgi:prolyl-tRNA synthetase